MNKSKDEKMQDIYNDIVKGMDAEEQVEDDIKNSAEEIASLLTMSPKKQARAEIDGKAYRFGYKILGDNEKIWMIIANETKQKIAQGSYLPFTATADIEDEYSMRENMVATVEAFIRHITGNFKAEALD